MTEPIPHLVPVVLAGGAGTRFWPLSRELSPKQLLTVFGGTSLVSQAIARVSRFAEPGRTVVLTSEYLLRELRDHLAGIGSDARVLAEPSARNTAAAVALAAAFAESEDSEALMAIVPSDHLLADGHAWELTMRTAVAAASRGWLVTIGLHPSAPETGYGYIRPGDELDVPKGAHRVERFLEKPDRETALSLISEGCLWNSGMLVARAAVVLDELHAAGERGSTPDSAHGATIARAARAVASIPTDQWTSATAHGLYDTLPSVQFDRAVLEVSDRVAVLPTRLDWSDVGSLLALQRLAEPDGRGNVLVGHATDIDSRDTIVYSGDRLVATLGLQDALVVDTADATLVTTKSRAQDVRLLVDALRAGGAAEVVSSRTAIRPWGTWTLLLKSEGFLVKTILVNPGRRLSLQSHAHRSEHWIVVEGTARIELDGEVVDAGPGHTVDIPVGAVHRLEAVGTEPLRIIEVALGDILTEDDIVRYEDDWERESRG
jgi:mannose-1-phosphate guanylyltransferase/mannose-6-phosphate isomerase